MPVSAKRTSHASTKRSTKPRRSRRRAKIVQLPIKNETIGQQPANVGSSDARELIKKVTEAAAMFGDTQAPPPSEGRAEQKPSLSARMMSWLRRRAAYLMLLVLCGSFLSAAPIQNVSSENSLDRIQAGQWVVASMYWEDKLTSTGKAFNPVGLYAAHKTLPIGTLIRVSNPKNHRSINITVNDRGPYVPGRDLDLTLGAGALLGFQGLGTLYMEVLAIPPFENVKRPLVENLFAANDANANVNCPTGEKCAFKVSAAR
jgi:hypothetical protein